MGAADSTETNAILAGGLAVVGLLGVAGAFLPQDMLPGTSQTNSQTVNEVSRETSTEESSQLHASDEPTETPAAEKTPVFKPVELQSISDGDPAPEQGMTVIEERSLEAAALMEVPPELVKAAEQALATPAEPVDAEQKEMEEERLGNVSEPTRQATQTPAQEGAVSSAGNDLRPEKPAQAQVAPAMPGPSNPVWNNWQNPGYQPPQFQQPQFAPPQYPPQPYVYPQWGGYPQR
jgi:hypothetical protein